MTAYKPVIIKEEVYNQLDSMKTKTNRSFSDVVENVLKENKELTEENKRITDTLETLASDEKRKGIFSSIGSKIINRG